MSLKRPVGSTRFETCENGGRNVLDQCELERFGCDSGDSVLLDREEEEDDSGFAETSQASASAVEDNWGEDWEAEV